MDRLSVTSSALNWAVSAVVSVTVKVASPLTPVVTDVVGSTDDEPVPVIVTCLPGTGVPPEVSKVTVTVVPPLTPIGAVPAAAVTVDCAAEAVRFPNETTTGRGERHGTGGGRIGDRLHRAVGHRDVATPDAFVVAGEVAITELAPEFWARLTETPAIGCGLCPWSLTVTVTVEDVAPGGPGTLVGEALTSELAAETAGAWKTTWAVWVTVTDPLDAV